jgi:MYXO-CTERM domain-containing protein
MLGTTRSRFAFAVLAALCALAPRDAQAIWPPQPDDSPEVVSRPENFPNDPDYAPAEGRRGQWQFWSWVPGAALALPTFRREEAALGAGNHVDRAWALSIGDPRVRIAVLDSGINWDNDDLLNKVALNTRELPMPMGATAHDANGDGVVNVLDYLNDTRIPCGVAGQPRNQLRCRGMDGMPNDPNRNGVLDAGDLIRVFSDNRDDDNNGYTDDIAGWDFFKDDNDPGDDTRYGHGTGEARDSSAETNNGRGGAGACPRCMFIPVRVGDSFITDSNDFAQGVTFAVDSGASVIQEALGTLNQSRFSQAAIDYAYTHNAVVIASAADENSRHHNMPGTANHAVYTHAVRYNGASPQNSQTFLAFNNCTNYGAQLVLSVGALNCSSAAVGYGSGIAGLIYSEALARNLTPALSAEEAKQLLSMTTDDIWVPESDPTASNFDPAYYPSRPGWDQRFGYGRTNARRALDWVRAGRIPPEVDIVSPRWFSVHDPDREPQRMLRIEGTIAARRAPRFDYTIEWAAGVEPDAMAWRTVRTERNVTAPVTDRLAEIDLRDIRIDNPGEAENRFTLTVRIRVVAHYDAPIGDVPGEVRRAFYVRRDPTVLPGFPIDTGGSGEGSAHLADLDGDGRREIVYPTADGEVHALRGDGTPLPGWPVRTGRLLGFDPMRTPSYLGAPAYRAGPMGAPPPIDPAQLHDPVIATPAIADLDGDGRPEVVVSTYHGTVHVFRADGTPYGNGFPFNLPDVPSADTNPDRILDRGIFGSPVVYDLDGDMRPEIVFGAFDGKLYALDGRTGMVKQGFPVVIHYPEEGTEYNRVFGSVGIGDMDGDRRPDIVVVSSERLRGDDNVGAAYVVYGDGNLHAGGPFHPNWPIAFTSFNFFPLVGEGLSSAPAIADLDGDGRDELALTGTANPTIVLARGVQPPHPPRPEPASLARHALVRTVQRGEFSNSTLRTSAFISAFSLGSFGDMNNDGVADYVISGAELNLALNLAGGGRARFFEHLVSAWDGRDGTVFPGFPRVIEDYTFFMNPAIADISNDGYAETILGTGGYYLHAFDACGRSPAGWPKFTGQWIIPNPALGDVTGDGRLDVVSGSRSGYLWAWSTEGDARTSSMQWPTHRHDNQNTGNWNTPVDQGVRRVAGVAPLQCPTAVVPDAGVAPADGSTAGTPQAEGGGCGCRTAGSTPNPRAPYGLATLLGLGLALSRRRRRVRA